MDRTDTSLLESILQQLDDAVFVFDAEGIYRYANEFAARNLGMTPSDLVGKRMRDVFPHEVVQRQMQSVLHVLETGERLSIEAETLIQGKPRFFHTTLFPVDLPDSPRLVALVARDITAKEDAQRVASRAEARNKSLLAAIPDMMFVVNEEGTFVDMNLPADANLALERSEIIGASIADIPDLADVYDAILEILRHTLSTQSLQNTEYQIKTPRGHGHFEVRMVPQGEHEVLLMVRDITEAKKAERALRESEALNKSLVDHAPIGILYIDHKGVITYENPALERLMGVPEGSSSAAIGIKYTDLNSLRAIGAIEFFDRLLEGEAIRDKEVEYTSIYGIRRNLSVVGQPLLDREGEVTGAILLLNDITELRDLESRFNQSQKMEAIGRLAGGVAHDFNNLLTGIVGHAELALLTLGQENPASKDLLEIQSISDRASLLTQQLLAFGRRQMIQLRILNLNEVILGMEQIFRRTIGEDLALHLHLDPELANTRGDRNQLGQVLLNLVVNARDALPRGGTLTIETHNAELDANYVTHYPEMKPGSYVQLDVIDDGVGMSEDLVEHIFEPFFTTKEEGKGTGLGLATVHGIVAQSGGTTMVKSALGEGTTFRVFLPASTEAIQDAPDKRDGTPVIGGSETILVVEDDPSVRVSSTRYLKRYGYKVFAAESPSQALTYFSEDSEQVDLILSDVILPEYKGPDLVDRIHKTHPGIPVLFMSGYTQDAVVRHGYLNEAIHYLPKPFQPAELARRVRELLDKHGN